MFLNELNKKNIEMIIKSTSNSKENSLEIIKVVDECIRQSKIIPITEPIIQKIDTHDLTCKNLHFVRKWEHKHLSLITLTKKFSHI